MKRLVCAVLLALLLPNLLFANEFYSHGSFPTTGSAATSAGMRAELDLITAGFNLLPPLAGHAGTAVVVNGSGNALTNTTGQLSLTGNFSIVGGFATTLTATGATNVTLPTTGTLATLAGAETLSNKTFSSVTFASPTFSGTAAGSLTNLSLITPSFTSPGFSTIVNTGTLTLPTSTDTLVARATTDTLTNKTLTAPAISNPTLSGGGTLGGSYAGVYTLAGTPTITAPAISNPTLSGGGTLGGSYAGTYTLAGTPTITAPAISNPVLSGTVTGTYTLGGTPTIPGTLTAGTVLTKNPVAFGSNTIQAHGLGVEPSLYKIILECLTAEAGYSIGDRVVFGSVPVSCSGSHCQISIVSDATNTQLIIAATAIQVLHKSTWGATTITAANWKMMVTPYRVN